MKEKVLRYSLIAWRASVVVLLLCILNEQYETGDSIARIGDSMVDECATGWDVTSAVSAAQSNLEREIKAVRREVTYSCN